MDPKNLSQLDPKLKEIYDRVMGTPVRPPASTSSVAFNPIQLVQPTTPQIVSPLQQPKIATVQVPKPPTPPVKAVSLQRKFSISPLLLFIIAVFLFLIYTFVWIRVFNLSLPFLP